MFSAADLDSLVEVATLPVPPQRFDALQDVPPSLARGIRSGWGGNGPATQRLSMGWRVLATGVVSAIGGFLLGGPVGAGITAAIGSSAAIIAEL